MNAMRLQTYTHPCAADIVQQARDILARAHAGKALLDGYKGKIEIIKGPLAQAFVPQTDLIYLRVPPLQKMAKIEQALDLAGALTEAKMLNTAEEPKPETLQDDAIIAAQHERNVDIILAVFPIAVELDEAGYKAVHSLRLMGLGKMFQAWKTGAEREECANIYWNLDKR